jgi:hypothetical protein
MVSISVRPSSLAQLRKQAKDLLHAVRRDDPLARKRVSLHLPESARTPSNSIKLAQTLHAIAREHGYPSWPRLVRVLQSPEEGSPSTDAPGTSRGWRQRFLRSLADRIANLAREGDIPAFVQAIDALPRRDGDTIRATLAASGELDAVIDALVAGLEHPNARIRFTCAGVLDHFADDRCVPALRRLLHDPVPRVRRMALHALGCDRCKLSPLQGNEDFLAFAIEQALHDPSIAVRRRAVDELAVRIADPRALQALKHLSQAEPDRAIRRTVGRALSRDG